MTELHMLKPSAIQSRIHHKEVRKRSSSQYKSSEKKQIHCLKKSDDTFSFCFSLNTLSFLLHSHTSVPQASISKFSPAQSVTAINVSNKHHCKKIVKNVQTSCCYQTRLRSFRADAFFGLPQLQMFSLPVTYQETYALFFNSLNSFRETVSFN